MFQPMNKKHTNGRHPSSMDGNVTSTTCTPRPRPSRSTHRQHSGVSTAALLQGSLLWVLLLQQRA